MMVLLNVERGGQEPVYRQIVAQLRRLIEDQALAVGEPLPSSRRMAERLGVNRSTVYRAYQELWAQGYIESRRGSYTTVRRRPRAEGDGPVGAPRVLDWGRMTTAASREVFRNYLAQKHQQPQGNDPPPINLSQLDLDPRLFPIAELRRSCDRALGPNGGRALQYGPAQGDRELRAFVADRARTHGMEVRPEEVLITNGSQQAIDLVLRVLTTAGQTVALEAPTYSAVLPLLRLNRLETAAVPMRPDGLDIEFLEHVIVERSPALVYTIPNFQNPTGITTSQQHRENLLALCERYRLPLVEDGFEEEMKYFGKVAQPIKAMDTGKVVVYLGTFSKVLFPGLRIGFVIADAECIERLTAVKRFADLSASNLVQIALNDFCRRGCYERHIRSMHREFRRRMQAAQAAAGEHLPKQHVRWTEPAGGYLIWVSVCGRRVDDELFDEICRRHGVVVSPGRYYYAESPAELQFRISISMLDEHEIREGFARLGKALTEFCDTAQEA
jgi:DNA-binding transcriptional MocR family regulator